MGAGVTGGNPTTLEQRIDALIEDADELSDEDFARRALPLLFEVSEALSGAALVPRETVEEADKLVSCIHDAVWAEEVAPCGVLHDEGREDSANMLIWKLHDLLRSALGAPEDAS